MIGANNPTRSCDLRYFVVMRLIIGWITIAAMSAACSFTDLPSDAGAGGSSASGAGNAAAVDCTVDEDCAPTGTDCIKSLCQAGTCVFEAEQNLQAISSQAKGDCLLVVCDGEGGEKVVNDIDDNYDDGNECTQDTCNDGAVANTVQPGKACRSGGGMICNSGGDCVECIDNVDCGDAAIDCADGYCVPQTCTDEVKSSGETAVDCGGSVCPPCADGADCLAGSDCQSLVCASQCQAPACDDMVSNGDESDADCGGAECAPCDDGKACNVPGDCSSGVCDTNECLAPTCNDGVLNGTETDIDCGSDCPNPCGTGDTCNDAVDCASLVCTGDECQAAQCNDGVQNGSESDVDCGGTCPTLCPRVGGDPSGGQIGG